MQPLQPRWRSRSRPARRRGADGEPADVVSLAFNSPTLGRLDLRLELRGERLLAGDDDPRRPSARHRQRRAPSVYAPTLEAAGLDATVKVRPRHQPLDLYA